MTPMRMHVLPVMPIGVRSIAILHDQWHIFLTSITILSAPFCRLRLRPAKRPSAHILFLHMSHGVCNARGGAASISMAQLAH